MMWHWFHGGWGGIGGMWFMPLIMIVILGLIIWGIVTLFRRAGWAGGAGCCSNSTVASDPAIDILRKRFASGEISKEEFEEKKKALS
jgi:putative membrane protein